MSSNLLNSPMFVAWDATYRCNLSCIHCCFGDRNTEESASNELSTDEAKAMLDELERIKIVSLQFAGGEPMMRSDFMELIEYASKKHFFVSLATNGMFIDQAIAKRFKLLGLNYVQLSLDGVNCETHELIRGTGTFKVVIEAIAALVDEGITVSVAALVGNHNKTEMNEMITYCHQLGVESFRLQYLMPQGNALNALDILHVPVTEIEMITQAALEHPLVKSKQIDLLLPCFYSQKNDVHKNIPKSKYIMNSCGAGTCSMNINPYGDITACGILTDSEWNCGNIREHSIRDIWKNSKQFEIWRRETNFDGKCGKCDYLQQCQGGCRASAFLIEGDLLANDPLCWR